MFIELDEFPSPKFHCHERLGWLVNDAAVKLYWLVESQENKEDELAETDGFSSMIIEEYVEVDTQFPLFATRVTG